MDIEISSLNLGMELMFIVGVLLFLLLLIILVLIRRRKKKKLRLEANLRRYSLELQEVPVLKQYVLYTSNELIFDSYPLCHKHNNPQDRLFLEEYRVGDTLNLAFKNMGLLETTISRISKFTDTTSSYGLAHQRYCIYLAEYENSEFPLSFTLRDNPFSQLTFDQDGLTLSRRQAKNQLPYEDLALILNKNTLQIWEQTTLSEGGQPLIILQAEMLAEIDSHIYIRPGQYWEALWEIALKYIENIF